LDMWFLRYASGEKDILIYILYILYTFPTLKGSWPWPWIESH